MIAGFEFVDAGRTFVCSVEPPRGSRPEAWWWFRLGSRDSQRYAPFRAAESDTREDVQTRIVAYYDDLQARRGARVAGPWAHHSRHSATPAAPAEAPGEAARAD